MRARKIFSAVAVAAMAAVMCVAFVGCDRAASMVSDEVTEEEWVAAFADENFENFKVTYKDFAKYSYGSGTESTAITEYKIVVANNMESLVETRKSSSTTYPEYPAYSAGSAKSEEKSEIFVDRSGETPVYYAKADGGWTKTFYSFDPTPSVSRYLRVKDEYASFAYNAKKNGYTIKPKSGMGAYYPSRNPFDGYIYKFKEGKLAAIYYEEESTVNALTKISVRSIVFDYGSQRLTPPKVA